MEGGIDASQHREAHQPRALIWRHMRAARQGADAPVRSALRVERLGEGLARQVAAQESFNGRISMQELIVHPRRG